MCARLEGGGRTLMKPLPFIAKNWLAVGMHGECGDAGHAHCGYVHVRRLPAGVGGSGDAMCACSSALSGMHERAAAAIGAATMWRGSRRKRAL